MAKYEVTAPSGEKFEITAPDHASEKEVMAYAQQQFASQKPKSEWENNAPITEKMNFKQSANPLKTMAMGGLKAAVTTAGNVIGPVADKLGITHNGQPISEYNKQELNKLFNEQNVNPESGLFKAGEVIGDIGMTSPVGGVLAQGAKYVPLLKNAPSLIKAIESSGMDVGGATGLSGLASRALGGAITGGASTYAINPENTKEGAAISAALPVLGKAAGVTGGALANAIRGHGVSPEVRALADKAEALGIDIPADRLTNSKFMNAIASTLNYVPFSGRGEVEHTMEQQLNKAASNLFGQDNHNITQALRNAKIDLGGKFENTLRNNTVKVDDLFLNDLAQSADTAAKELGSDQAKIIKNQVDEILAKANQAGEIDGQAAYNIKKRLDVISDRNSPEAFYARDLKKKLMDALNRSLGSEQAQAFAKTRQQYGNMLSLENLAQNGAEGGISVARLANMKNINNPELQTLADIAAQFVKQRESQHSSMQRALAGSVVGLGAGMPYLLGSMLAGRGLNTALHSNAVKNFVENKAAQNSKLAEALRKGLPLIDPALIAQ